MKLSELIIELEYLQDQIGDDIDPEIFIAEQPSWPFKYSVSSVVIVETDDNTPEIYIEEGQQLEYLSRAAKDELGW